MEEIMMDRLSSASSQDGGAVDDHRNSHADSDSASSQYGGAVDDHRNSYADHDSASSQDGGSNSHADNDSASSVSASYNAVNAPGSSSSSSTSCFSRHLKLIALILLIAAVLIGVIVVVVVPVSTKQEVDTGEWGEWGLWSNCSAVCNGGYQRRNRSCVSDGFNCEGDKDENRTCSLEPCPGDCSDVTTKHHISGVYIIYPWANLTRPKQVYCEISDDGAWTVMQRRIDGSVNFYRNWTDYKAGFGEASGEYWLGNDAIHAITSRGNYTLTIRLTNWDNITKFANYSMFRIANESDGYRLNIKGYSGEAGDDMRYNNGDMFSTVDMDNDQSSDINCAERYRGAWWYWSCSLSNLNGVYHPSARAPDYTGIFWYRWHGGQYSLKATTMMIQRH